ncbi:MAG TPA: flagellar basal-body MS-ring/collar protein FliF [Terriglobia bacterium]|nr:flagellar basal-body MS-ring/collar protein FliF [Terriglobia bacterium]
MASEPNSILSQLNRLNSTLTLNQKVSIAILGLLVLCGVSYLVFVMNQEEYQTLYSSLNAEEANTVITKLKELKVPFQLQDGGKAIKVPASRVDELRIQLASEGLPQSGKIGFEIFDKTNLGMTEFLEKVSYKRALEGELARTILSLKEVAEVRVHLVLPKESLFQERAEPTKASVVLKLNAGKQLNETMVSGIVHLVSSAVEGLTPQNVTVVDASGRLLSAKQSTPDEALTNGQLEMKSRAEKEFTTKIVNMLEPIVGPGKVKADTSVSLDFSRTEQTEEKYDPQATAIRSQQKSQERSEPANANAAAGVPGTKSNQATPPPNVTPITVRGSNSFTKTNELTNYEVSKLIRHTIEPFGDIKRLSVAIIVDDAVKLEKGADGKTTKKMISRNPEELKKIKDLVTAALGIDSKRGDVLTVENIAFDTPLDTEEVKPTFYEKWRDLLQPAIKYTSLLLLFLLVYILLIRPISKKVLAPVQEVLRPQEGEMGQIAEGAEPGPLALEAPKTVKELEAALGAGENVPALPEMNVRKSDILKQRIQEFVQREPENVAALIRVWLTEEDGA